jgi:hypothetical protein
VLSMEKLGREEHATVSLVRQIGQLFLVWVFVRGKTQDHSPSSKYLDPLSDARTAY